MNIANTRTLNKKWRILFPLIGVAVVAGMAVASQGLRGKSEPSMLKVNTDSPKAASAVNESNNAAVEVKVNGVPVPLNRNGSAHVNTGHGNADIKVNSSQHSATSGGSSITTNSANGDVNVSIKSHSSTNAGGSDVRYRETIRQKTSTDSNVRVRSDGSGHINIETSN